MPVGEHLYIFSLCPICLFSFILKPLIFFYSLYSAFLCLTVFPSLSLKAFAWWSDLMVEHAETFLCLYSADMDAALEVQPPDSWDSFPLFQLLNDFLRIDCKWGAIKMKPLTFNMGTQVAVRAWQLV